MDEYRQQLCNRFLSAPVTPTPAPWVGLPAPNTTIPAGGLVGRYEDVWFDPTRV